jgi:pimeloyl-ACP methyl ester carboxylesterase
MKKKRKKAILIIVLFLCTFWLVHAQRTMQFRETDEAAKKEFAQLGITLVTRTIDLSNSHLHYVSVGNDTLPTLFFVHGSPGSWDVFKTYLQDSDLGRHYRMIAVDRPGFGYSDFMNARNLSEQSHIISSLLDSIKNDKPLFLIGHSLGGPLILKLDLDNPASVSGLVILAGALDPKAEKPEKWRPVLFKTPLNYFVPGAMRPSNEELWYLKKDLKKLDKELDKVFCPVWLMHGDKDNLVPVGNVDYARQKLKNVKSLNIRVLQGANHFIPWTHFKEIKKLLLSISTE